MSIQQPGMHLQVLEGQKVEKIKLEKVTLSEGEYSCEECDGTGFKPEFLSDCKKCEGTGKFDWIENIVGKKTSNISPLDRINTKSMLLLYIKRTIYNKLENIVGNIHNSITIDIFKNNISRFLDDIKSRRGFYDYYINIYKVPPNDPFGKIKIITNIIISIKLNKTAERVELRFEVF